SRPTRRLPTRAGGRPVAESRAAARGARGPRSELPRRFPRWQLWLGERGYGVAAVHLGVGGFRALDRVGVLTGAAAELDLHLPGLLLLWLGDPQLEHAVVEARLHRVGVDTFGKGERAGE